MNHNPANPCPSLTKVDGVVLMCELERDHDGDHSCNDEHWTETTL